jgi:hypothetical protein
MSGFPQPTLDSVLSLMQGNGTLFSFYHLMFRFYKAKFPIKGKMYYMPVFLN